MELLTFITAGNVDDGKSTLIGRLLYDSHAISNDILESIQGQDGEINFAHLTDGLKAEREQGITIDVAYRYFSTEKRKFIIADCPGHKEYTRNMITGASHADASIILIDATKGINEQTKRHIFILDLMNIPCLIFCINKMDMVGYEESTYIKIVQQITAMTYINSHQIEYIPISALKGDNVVKRSENMKWYKGNTLMHLLENFHPEKRTTDLPALVQIQYATFEDNERYFYGTLLNGTLQKGDEILIFPTQQKNIIKEIYKSGEITTNAQQNQAIVITLNEDTDIQRGYYVIHNDSVNTTMFINKASTKEFLAVCFWLDNQEFIPTKRYYIQHHSFRTYIRCKEIKEYFDIDELKFKPYHQVNISMNAIFKAVFIAASELLLMDYRQCPSLGSFIIVDETSHRTVGAGILM
jgi:sulfate adenylyltransferase subunit 1